MSRSGSEQRNAGPSCKPRRSTWLWSRRIRRAPVQAREERSASVPELRGLLPIRQPESLDCEPCDGEGFTPGTWPHHQLARRNGGRLKIEQSAEAPFQQPLHFAVLIF